MNKKAYATEKNDLIEINFPKSNPMSEYGLQLKLNKGATPTFNVTAYIPNSGYVVKTLATF